MDGLKYMFNSVKGDHLVKKKEDGTKVCNLSNEGFFQPQLALNGDFAYGYCLRLFNEEL